MTARRWLTTSSTRWICSPTRRAHRRRCRCSWGVTRAATAVDDHTVKFTLEAANGNVPRLTRQPQRHHHQGGQRPQGLRRRSREPAHSSSTSTPKVGASFVRNDDYWGTKANPDRIEFTFYDEGPQILALQGKQVDVVGQISVSGGRAISTTPASSSTSRRPRTVRCTCRVTRSPLADKRVRQAVALSLRPAGDRPSSAVRGQGEGRQRQPICERLSVDRPLRAAAHAERRPGEAAALGRRTVEPVGQDEHGRRHSRSRTTRC
jgi:hypothetical protein